MAVEIFLDLSKYSDEYSRKLAQRVTVAVRVHARQFVAKKTKRLMNSIRTEAISRNQFQTVSETPYSAAQEYGRPDLPHYTFTPYMRPAALKSTEQSNLDKYAKEAEIAARRKAKV